MSDSATTTSKINPETGKPVSYTIVVPTIYGQMLVNRHDINQTGMLLKTGAAHDAEQIRFAQNLCVGIGRDFIVLDIGANLGVYTLGISQVIADLGGVVHAFEGQRQLAHLICGSLALNSIANAHVHNVCVGNSNNDVDIPKFNYHQPMNFGSVEFGTTQKEKLQQERLPSTEKVKQVRIDDYNFQNVKFLKMDIEGMEIPALLGAQKTITQSRPVALVEYIKSDRPQIEAFFRRQKYVIVPWGTDLLCIPDEEKPRFADGSLGLKVF